jgi:hypothetical protein
MFDERLNCQRWWLIHQQHNMNLCASSAISFKQRERDAQNENTDVMFLDSCRMIEFTQHISDAMQRYFTSNDYMRMFV